MTLSAPPKITLFSLGATKRLVNALETFRDMVLLKGSALLYPQVLLNTAGKPFREILEITSEGLTQKQKMALSRVFIPITQVDDSPVFSNGQLLQTVLKAGGVKARQVIRHFQAVEATYDGNPLRNPYHGKDVDDDPEPIFMLYLSKRLGLPYYDSSQAGARIQELLNTMDLEVSSDQKLAAGLPDLKDLSWEAILDLRKSKYIRPFRKFILSFSGEPEDLIEEINQGLWETVKANAPSPSGDVIHRILANLPLPSIPVNPYGISREAKSWRKEVQTFNRFGWLYFLQEAREK